MNSKKRITSKKIANVFIVVIILFSCFFTSCSSEKKPLYIPNVLSDTYVYDSENILDNDTFNRVNNILIDIEEKTEIEFVVLTVEDFSGRTIEDYSVEVGNELGIGKKETDNGILLVFSSSESEKDNTSVRFEIGNGIQEFLTDSKSGKVLDVYFVPHKTDKEYNLAIEETVKAIARLIEEDYDVEIIGLDGFEMNLSPKSMPTFGQVLLALMILALIVSLILFLIYCDDSSSGSSGGYFGGSSGGSGGGFGGGGFSGGGASR